MDDLAVRFAGPADVDAILHLIRQLARYEREPDAVKTTRDDLLRDGFGERPLFEVLLAEAEDRPAGFALFFTNYSTWEGRGGIYLEDLFVEEWARGKGVGRALMARLAELVRDRGGARLDLSVLDWNRLAIDFYDRLGLEPMATWRGYRLTGDALERLARQG